VVRCNRVGGGVCEGRDGVGLLRQSESKTMMSERSLAVFVADLPQLQLKPQSSHHHFINHTLTVS